MEILTRRRSRCSGVSSAILRPRRSEKARHLDFDICMSQKQVADVLLVCSLHVISQCEVAGSFQTAELKFHDTQRFTSFNLTGSSTSTINSRYLGSHHGGVSNEFTSRASA